MKRLLLSFVTSVILSVSVCASAEAAQYVNSVDSGVIEAEVIDVEEDDPQIGRAMGYVSDGFLGKEGEVYPLGKYSDTYTHDSRFDNYTIKEGIDVSKYQANIDWERVKADGVDFAFIRVGARGYGDEGNLIYDSMYETNMRGAKAAGLSVGVYVFSQATTVEEAREEAQFALDNLGDIKPDLPIVIDFEYASTAKGIMGRLYDARLSVQAATDVCNAFCERITSAGYEAMVYANYDMLTEHLYADQISSKYKIWIAHYTYISKYEGDFDFWQCSSKKHIDGISGNVDYDFWYVNDGNAGYTPEDKTRQFVKRLYSQGLGRLADSYGLEDWTSKLQDGTITGSEAAYGFIFSPEFVGKNYCNKCFVEKLYTTIMGRKADEVGLNGWMQALSDGMKREEVFNGFITSQEFENLCAEYDIQVGNTVPVPENGTTQGGACSACGAVDSGVATDGVTQFVTRLYTVCLDRKPDSAGLADWTEQLRSGSNNGTNVAAGFIFSREFSNRGFSDSTYIEYLYRSIMGREYDGEGKTYWENKMRDGASRREVFDGFVGSQEFDNLCKSYGIKR